MQSRNCDGCSQKKVCSIRYKEVEKDEKVCCPDGTAHLVDENVACCAMEVFEHIIKDLG